MSHNPFTIQSHGLAALTLGAVLLGSACQSSAPVANSRPTDSGFEALRQRRGPISLDAPARPTDLDGDTQKRIAESVSMLDEYFAQDANSSSQSNNAPANSNNTLAYDPSAERGPTGTSHLARLPRQPDAQPVESALLAASIDLNTTPVQIQPLTPRQDSATDRLLSGFDLIDVDGPSVPPVQPSVTKTPTRMITIASPVFEPGFSWPLPPRGIGLITADQDDPFDPMDLGPAIASADGSLPALPPTLSDPGFESEQAGEPTLSSRKHALAEELVGILTQLAKTDEDPYRLGLALAGLETLSPGSLYELVDSGELLPHETEILLSAHEFFQGLASDPKQANPESAMDLIDSVRERLNQSAPLRITAAELCTRVWGYGQYDTFDKSDDGSYRFIVGRRQPVIIYTEVDRFGRIPTVDAQGVSQWRVELSQELQIFHLADDLLVTARSAETDTSLSRSMMRDYYLINQTSLPESLSLGKYHLKVIMRDANKDAIAETVIPFEIVTSMTLDGL